MEDWSMCRIRYLADDVTEDHEIYGSSGSRLKGSRYAHLQMPAYSRTY